MVVAIAACGDAGATQEQYDELKTQVEQLESQLDVATSTTTMPATTTTTTTTTQAPPPTSQPQTRTSMDFAVELLAESGLFPESTQEIRLGVESFCVLASISMDGEDFIYALAEAATKLDPEIVELAMARSMYMVGALSGGETCPLTRQNEMIVDAFAFTQELEAATQS